MKEEELKEVDINPNKPEITPKDPEDPNVSKNTKPKLERRLSYYPNETDPLGLVQMLNTDGNVPKEEVEVIEGKGKFIEFDYRTKFYYEIDGEDYDKKIILLNPYISTIRIYDELAKNLVKEGFCVLRFDYRAMGKTESAYERITSTRSAEDAVFILEKLKWEKVHVFGYGYGGMIAQELAILLFQKKMLASLYLANTSSGSFLRFGGGPDFYEDAILNFVLNKSEIAQQDQFIHDNFSDPVKQQVNTHIRENWKIFFDHRMKARTTQCSVYYGHYVSLKRLSVLTGKIPIAIQVSREDNFHKVSDQLWLVDQLKATKVEFEGCVEHLDSLFIKVGDMSQAVAKNANSAEK